MTGHHVDPATTAVLSRANWIVAVHYRTTDGWCAGCLNEDRWCFHPCYQAEWAARVRRVYSAPQPRDRTDTP